MHANALSKTIQRALWAVSLLTPLVCGQMVITCRLRTLLFVQMVLCLIPVSAFGMFESSPNGTGLNAMHIFPDPVMVRSGR